MGKAAMEFKKIIFVFEPELTQVYVAINAIGDCPLGVQGWHHKTFPSSRAAIDIMVEDLHDAVMWPLNSPES